MSSYLSAVGTDAAEEAAGGGRGGKWGRAGGEVGAPSGVGLSEGEVAEGGAGNSSGR